MIHYVPAVPASVPVFRAACGRQVVAALEVTTRRSSVTCEGCLRAVRGKSYPWTRGYHFGSR